MTLYKEFEQNVQIVIEHLEKCVEEIKQLYVFSEKDNYVVGLQGSGKKAYNTVNLLFALSSPPQREFERILKWLIRDMPQVKDELEKQYYDIVSDSKRISKVSDPLELGHQLTSLETKILRLSDYLSYCLEMAQETEAASGKAAQENLTDIEQKITFRETGDGRSLIQRAEGQTLEFKETLTYNIHTKQEDKEVLKASLKTIVGFLNTNGGTLLIGVSDDGNIKGLKEDFAFVPKKNQDGFEQKLRSFIRSRFDPEPVGQINITFEEFNGKVICRVVAKAYKEITHLDNETYVRDGNQTLKLEGRRLTDWIRQRPPR